MDHQLFAALFVLALIGQQLATAAPLSAATKSSTKSHHQGKHGTQLHHQGQHGLSSRSSIREIENILKELDDDTTVLVAEKDKVIEIYPQQRELPAGTEEAPPAPRRLRRSNKRRSRRSAALLLHATLRMCNLRPIHCQSVVLQRDNVRVNIRLVDQ